MGVRYLDLVNEITAPMPPLPVAELGPPALTPLDRPLAEATVMLVNSAGVHLRVDPPFAFVDDLTCRRLEHSLPPTALRPCHPSPIRRPGRQDVNVVYPYQRLDELATGGLIAKPAPFHVSTLGAIKQVTRIVTELGPAVVRAAAEAGADLVMVVPLCPACHQAMGLLARVVELLGMPTVSVTGARDITERVRPPRAAYLDYPLGYCVGRPGAPDEQRAVVADVLSLVERPLQPGEIVDLPYRWPDDGWERGVERQYWEERETVRSQRQKEFAGDVPADAEGGALGRHLAFEEVEAVEAMAASGRL
jgi:D-proline reductase (dithiol) PrdB